MFFFVADFCEFLPNHCSARVSNIAHHQPQCKYKKNFFIIYIVDYNSLLLVTSSLLGQFMMYTSFLCVLAKHTHGLHTIYFLQSRAFSFFFLVYLSALLRYARSTGFFFIKLFVYVCNSIGGYYFCICLTFDLRSCDIYTLHC